MEIATKPMPNLEDTILTQLRNILSTSEYMALNQAKLAESLGVHTSTISLSLKHLVLKKKLIEGPKSGRNLTYMMAIEE